jgi:ABC-2 type transport system ATP-binding protein
MVIDVRALTKVLRRSPRARGIDLSIAATGQIIGLLGPNGAGKTTFVEILEGLRTATAGTVSVLGLDPARASGALRARIGVQLQTTAFMQDLTVTETLKLYGSLYPGGSGVSRIVAARSGSISSTKPRRWCADCPVDSGSASPWRWRCSTIPICYILDEPTSGLDPSRGARFTTSCCR